MNQLSHNRDDYHITGDLALYSLIVDDLPDCQVVVETSSDEYEGYIDVASENPFLLRVAGEPIFASDIKSIHSLETEARWDISGIEGVVDSNYRPNYVKDAEVLNSLEHPKRAKERTDTDTESNSGPRQRRERGEPKVPKELNDFVSLASAKKVELILQVGGEQSTHIVFVRGAHQDMEGWKLVVLDTADENKEKLIPLDAIDFSSSKVIAP